MMPLYELGARVQTTHVLHRRSETRITEQHPHGERWKFWFAQKLATPFEGIIVGERTYSDGVNFSYANEPLEYHPRTHYKVLLVVTQLWVTPHACLPEHVSPIL